MKELQVEINIDTLENASNAFKDKYGRYPATVDELKAAGLIKGEPKDELGGIYVLNPETGEASNTMMPRRLRIYPMKEEEMIRTEGLQMEFRVGFMRKRVLALKGLTMEVKKGEVFGFLGPNGAGKTTTIKILMGLVYPTGGAAWLMGRPLGDVAVKRNIGFLPEQPYFYDYLTAAEFMDFYGRLFGIRKKERMARADELLDLVGLSGARDLQLRKFSKGMQQRIGIAQALINDPELVVLDEPMSGLDPIGRKQVRDIILGLKAKGKTIFFSTHILPDVEVICDRVGMLVKGELRAMGTVGELLSGMRVKSVEMTFEGVKRRGPLKSGRHRIGDGGARPPGHGHFLRSGSRKQSQETGVRFRRRDNIAHTAQRLA